MKKLRYKSINCVNYKWVKIAFKKFPIKKITIFMYKIKMSNKKKNLQNV